MNEPDSTDDQDRQPARPVFISYATIDRKQALSVCKAMERRDVNCWISTRDVAPGENYQEAIVRSLRGSRAMVLIFSQAANHSDEIKKELSLASRYRVPVIALRIADVEPSDAFAYELSTRQWIDAFEGWDRSIDALVSRIAQLSGDEAATPPAPGAGRKATFAKRPAAIAIAGLVLLLAAAGLWWWLRPTPGAAHSMTVRLAGFQLLSTDLPASTRQAVDAEVAAAFNADGVVGVSTAPAPPPGTLPAYALGGTIQREGDAIRVITRLVNERSGATLWTSNFDYDGKEVTRIPRHIAVDAGNVVRCGLFGASTYRKPLPDPVFRDYLQFCQGHWNPALDEGRKALVPAQRVVAAVPDFSWGWAAVAGAYWKVAMSADNERLAEEARASGRQAADRGIALDSKNSEALYIKSMLVDRHDWLTRESLLKRAVEARRLDCGCEHHQYGWMLLNVGRIADGLDELRRANDMLALYVYTPLTLAEGLVAAAKLDEARSYFQAAAGLAPTSAFAAYLTASQAMETDDEKLMADPRLPIDTALRAALLKAHRARALQDAAARAEAVKTLLALPADQLNASVAVALSQLGARHEAFQVAARVAASEYPGPSLFFYRSMRGTLDDPGFPPLAARFGLINYWKVSKTRPDVCGERAPPAFCRMI